MDSSRIIIYVFTYMYESMLVMSIIISLYKNLFMEGAIIIIFALIHQLFVLFKFLKKLIFVLPRRFFIYFKIKFF
jgi:hypothetical protein